MAEQKQKGLEGTSKNRFFLVGTVLTTPEIPCSYWHLHGNRPSRSGACSIFEVPWISYYPLREGQPPPEATGDTVAAVPVAAAPGLPVPTDRRQHAALTKHRDASIELAQNHLQAVDPGPAEQVGPFGNVLERPMGHQSDRPRPFGREPAASPASAPVQRKSRAGLSILILLAQQGNRSALNVHYPDAWATDRPFRGFRAPASLKRRHPDQLDGATSELLHR